MLTLPDLVSANSELRAALLSGWRVWRSGPHDSKLWPLLFLAAQALRHHEAIELLAERGFGREAGVLLRSMFEATVNAVWISRDLDTRIERYVDYQYVGAEKWRRVAQRLRATSQGDETPRNERNDQQRQQESRRVTAKHGFREGEHWSGKTLRTMAKDIGWGERYDSIYRIYSEVLHSGVVSAQDYVSQVTSGGLMVTVGPQLEQAYACLLEAHLYLTTTFEVANDCLGMGLEAQLDKAWAVTRAILPRSPV